MEIQQVLVLVLVLVSVERSECVQCFAHFNLSSGQCDEAIGEVDEDSCCQNSQYGYQATDGVCQFCGHQVLSPWSPWSLCTTQCGEGVRQRSKRCFGFGQNCKTQVMMEPCNGTCCNEKGWGLWFPWLPCSVTCGGGGVRKRTRVCASPPECHALCSGSSEETDSCPTQTTCPVHGDWSNWSAWTKCSASCIDGQGGNVITPYRQRHRSCSNPAPSVDTVPPGNRCPGDDVEVQPCSELPNCPVDGGWGAWSSFRECSTSCGEGLQLSIRTCNQPTPKYGGRLCDGPSTRTNVCHKPCPVDGFWTGWSSWGECSSTCTREGQRSVWTRHRSCSNPAPSTSPPGRGCQGDNRQTENCSNLPHCRVDGAWGAWSPFSSCSVTCGVGLQESVRKCNSPAPKHNGQPCPGEERQTRVCKTDVHCPVDGVWAEWSSWGECKYPHNPKTVIRCKKIFGAQTQTRHCILPQHNGALCSGSSLIQTRACYDVSGCLIQGNWEGWEPWASCRKTCGSNTQRGRRKICKLDYSGYNLQVGPQKVRPTFFGTALGQCGLSPVEIQPCRNLPPCP